MKLNILNEIHNDKKFAAEVLKKQNYDEEYKQEAFKKLLEAGDLKDIKRFVGEIKFNKDLANKVLGMCYAQKMDFSDEEVQNYVQRLATTKKIILL